VGDEELLVGAVVDVVDCEDEEDTVPDSPVVPASAESPAVPAEESWVLVDPTETAPGRSWATIVPRVSMRSRDRALSRSEGVLGWADSDMCVTLLGWRTPSEHARFDTDAEPAVVLL
jgi:hypothetical protein